MLSFATSLNFLNWNLIPVLWDIIQTIFKINFIFLIHRNDSLRAIFIWMLTKYLSIEVILDLLQQLSILFVFGVIVLFHISFLELFTYYLFGFCYLV